MKIFIGRFLILFFFTLSSGLSSAQILFSDDFQAGSGNWTLNGGFGQNIWIVNASYIGGFFTSTPSQPAGISNPNSNYLHIHNTTVCSFGECQAIFDTGSSSDQTATMTNNVSTLGQTGVTLSFWYLCNGASGISYGFVEYSTDNGTTWTNATPNYTGISMWTQETLTNPAWDNQANLKFRWHWINGAAGSDPAFSVDDVLISVPTGSGSITTDNVSLLSWCQGTNQSVTVDFTATGTYNAGNVFTAELSDASGSFLSPTVIGTLNSSTSGAQIINATVPGTVLAGANYRIRVISSSPALIGTDNGSNITIFPSPSAPVVGVITQPDCITSTGSVDLSGLPASGSWTLDGLPWSVTQSGSGTSFTFSNLTANTTYNFTVTDNNGCESAPSLDVVINPLPTPPPAPSTTINSQPSCAVPTGEFEVTAPLGSNYTYSIGSGDQSSPVFSGLNPNTYSVTVTDLNTGCISATSTVTIDPIANGPQITVQSTTDVSCANAGDGEATVSVTGGTSPYTYDWQPSGGSLASANGLGGGVYVVTVTDDSGCSSSQNITIQEPNPIVASETITNSDCGNPTGEINVTVNGGTGTLSYQWDSGQTTEDLSGIGAGTYVLVITDANGCSIQENYTVDEIGGLTIFVSPNQATIEAGETVQLNASGATTYTWNPSGSLSCANCSDPVASPNVTTSYTVTGTDTNGCSGTANVLITVNPNCTDFFVPTAFSPDGNGMNDELCVYGNCITNLNYAVYNRWGQLLFETSDPDVCWDGTFKGQKVQSGEYVYKVTATLFDGTRVQEAGNLKILR